MQPDADQLAEELLTLLKIPSVTGDEAVIADHVEARCRSWGLSVERYGSSVVAEPAEAKGGRRIGLFGHLDTVPGPPDLGRPRREGDRLIGLGASDMKAGVAVQLLLLRDCSDFQHHPVAVFYDNEEGSYTDNALGPLLKQRRDLAELDFAVVLEPTDNQLHLGASGTLHADVIFSGRRAHSARPWQGENAIYKAWPLLQRLAQLKPREHDCAGLLFREVMSVTVARGGSARNVVPDEFRLNLSYRFPPGKSLEEAQEEVRSMVASEAEVAFTDLAPAGTVCMDHPDFCRLQALSCAETLPKQAWTDVARLNALGVAAVNYGPGRTDQAHQKGEWVSLAECQRSLNVLRRFFRQEDSR